MTRATLRIACSLCLCTALALADTASAQIVRHPTGVNVNAMGATTIFLTFGNLAGKVPVEALWCGALEPATPDIGDRCDPATIFGRLPLRYDLSRPGATDGFTDIMSIPASVARRAYQAAARGEPSEFFYVRRFADPSGGPDEYVTVTCRLTDGGARTPFSITDVRLGFATGDVVAAVRTGAAVPAISARIVFNGTGRLRGRWEVVRPGEDPPSQEDLLPEASLPLEQRTRQRRYSEIDRFDVLLPPVGDFVLPGPAAGTLPTAAPGQYLLLLRIEASDDKEGDSQIPIDDAPGPIAHSGGVAGFAIPPLRYHVGEAGSVGTADTGFRTLEPRGDALLDARAATRFSWSAHPGALFYRFEITSLEGTVLRAALVPREATGYTPPGGIAGPEGTGAGPARWRVVALGTGGRVLTSTAWRSIRLH